jgi:hypothetical protein
VSVVVNPLPTTIATATNPTCTFTTANNNGIITLSGFLTGETYQYSLGNVFTSSIATPVSPTTIPINGILTSSLNNPSNATQDYTVRIYSTNGCYIDRVVTLTQAECCPTIATPSANQTLCIGDIGSNITVQTDQNTASSIRFVRFATQQTGSSMYLSGGTVLATVTPTGASSPYTATLTTATANWSALATGTYYLYAILNPMPSNATCRPYQEIQIAINPVATADAGVAQTVCVGGTVALAGTVGGSATSGTWSAPSGTFSDETSLTSTYTPSITSGTVTLTLTTDDPTGPCPAATSTVVITVNQTPSVASAIVKVDTATCTNGVVNSNAKVKISGIVNGVKYSYGMNGTTGLYFATATTMTTDSIVLSGLANPSVSTTYTFRIYGADSICYKDITATLPPSVCPQCSITGTFTQNTCNNNGTAAIMTDDYFTVTISSISAINGGTSGKYEVVLNGTTVLNTGGTAYGSPVTVGGAGVFAADGTTTYTLTVRDLNNQTCVSTNFVTTATQNCSTCPIPLCIPVIVTRSN